MSDVITVNLEIKLITDVCLSTSSRTFGAPETFTCIPGRALWGAAASRAYRQGMSEEEGFAIFHQGRVRIFDAVPMVDGKRGYPVPRSWHRPKGDSSPEAFNFVLKAVRDENQDKQCRPLGEGWVVPEGSGARSIEVRTAHSMRTSMDPSGAPRQGLLFGIPTIQAGARFWTAVSGPKAYVETVVQHLLAGDVRVGRSRRAEMGLISVTRTTSPEALVSGAGEVSRVSIFCVSRCLLRDPRTGSPTTVPFPRAFQLKGDWTYDEAASFIRTARFTTYNAQRKRPEADRFALERGCVVTFASPSGQVVDLGELAEKLRGGVGEHRGEGYGEVVLAPSWVCDPRVTIRPQQGEAPEKVQPPEDELFTWAKMRSEARDKAVSVYQAARTAADALRPCGVPPAQWGRIHKLAREARFRGKGAGLVRELFGEYDRPVEAKPYLDVKDRPDRIPGGVLGSGKARLSRQWKNARPILLGLCKPYEGDGDRLSLFLEHLAGACMRDTSEMEG